MAVHISEMLCYIFGKYGKMPSDSIRSVLVSFYDGAEILVAKELLFKCVADLNLDGAPRCVSRRKSDEKARLDSDDILALVSFVDERAAFDLLPQFVAANLERVPPLQSDVLDLCLAVNRIAALESKMEQLMLHCVQPPAPQAPVGVPCERQSASTAGVSGDCPSLSTSAAPAVQVSEGSSSTWTSVVSDAAQSDGQWQIVHQRKEKPKSAVRIRGVKANEGAVKAVPRKPVLAAFVGRLHSDTTEEGLTEYLMAEGMKGMVCKRLKPKDSQRFRTAAFYVSCCVESSALFYNEECWPVGVELRDWVYKQR